MKKSRRKLKPNGEELLEKAKRIVEEEGAKGWDLAKETLLKQETRNLQFKKAINYIILQPDFFRPAIISLCSKAVGGDSEVTIPCGASLVLLGKAIGIHDDIIDDLKMRNKRLTFFGKFGKEIALILSDILLFKGFTLIRKNVEIEVPKRSIAEILDTIDHVWFEQSEGEFLELRSRRQIDITPQECLAKIKMRASEMEAITRIGGILGDGSREEIDALGKYGRFLGMASILRDELIDMLEFSMLRHRIRNESLPLPLVYTMQNNKGRPKIISMISKKRLTTMDLQMISRASEKAGGINYVAEYITKMVEEACAWINLFKGNNEKLTLLAISLTINFKDWKEILQPM